MTENQIGRAPARAKIGSQLATLAQACFKVSVPAVGPDLVTKNFENYNKFNGQAWCISYKLIKTSCKLGSPLQADLNQLQILQICRHLELQLDWRHLPTGCHLLHLAWSWSWDWYSMKPQWQKWWLAVAGFHGLCQGQQSTRQENPTRQEATRQEKQGQEPRRPFSTPSSGRIRTII